MRGARFLINENENSKYKYRNDPQSQNVTNKIHDLLMSPNLRPIEIAVGIKDLLMNNAKTTKLSSKKSRNTGQVKPEPWFDEECKKTKHKLNILGKNLKLAPGDQTIRVALFDQKRNFRKIALAKKRRYKKNIMNELATKKK